MDSELIARISPEHRRRLAWFEEHQGEVSSAPTPLPGDLPLVHPRKGIYKPAGLPYALSIKIKLNSPYADGVPEPAPGGGWLLHYHQEGANPAARDTTSGNRGLMQCIADRVPVGVLREQAPARSGTRYRVLGLAMPVRWDDGSFYFKSLDPQEVPVADPVSDVLEAKVSSEVAPEAAGARRPRVPRVKTAESDPLPTDVRYKVLAAANGRCTLCGATSGERRIEVNRIVPLSRGGSNDISNLQALCDECSRGKSKLDDDTDFRARRISDEV